MSYPPTPARPASGMAKGAAIAALVYFGLILVLLEALVLLGGSVLSALIREAEDYSSSSSSLSTGALVGVMALVILFVLAFPIGFAVWMLLGAVKNSPVNVLVPLIIFSVFSVLSLGVTLVSRQNGDSTVGAGIGLNLPWYAILVFGWLGWVRMNRAGTAAGANAQALGGYAGYPAQTPGYPPQTPGYPPQNPSGYPTPASYGSTPAQPAQYGQPQASRYGQDQTRQYGQPQASPYPAPAAWQPGPTPDTAANRAAPADQARYEQSEPTRRLPPPEAWPPSGAGWEQPTDVTSPPVTDSDTSVGSPTQPPTGDEPTIDQRSPWARPDEPADPDDTATTH